MKVVFETCRLHERCASCIDLLRGRIQQLNLELILGTSRMDLIVAKKTDTLCHKSCFQAYIQTSNFFRISVGTSRYFFRSALSAETNESACKHQFNLPKSRWNRPMTMNLAGKIESSPPPGQKRGWEEMGQKCRKVSHRLLFVWRFLFLGHLWDCLHGHHGALDNCSAQRKSLILQSSSCGLEVSLTSLAITQIKSQMMSHASAASVLGGSKCECDTMTHRDTLH